MIECVRDKCMQTYFRGVTNAYGSSENSLALCKYGNRITDLELLRACVLSCGGSTPRTLTIAYARCACMPVRLRVLVLVLKRHHLVSSSCAPHIDHFARILPLEPSASRRTIECTTICVIGHHQLAARLFVCIWSGKLDFLRHIRIHIGTLEFVLHQQFNIVIWNIRLMKIDLEDWVFKKD